MNRSKKFFLSGALLALVGLTGTRGSSAQTSAGTITPFAKVRPILEQNCLGCHGGKPKKASGFDLSTREGLLRGGDRGSPIVPGDAQNSLLYKLITWAQEPNMPYMGALLPDEAIASIADWINAGAPYDEPLVKPDQVQASHQPVAVDHWAFKVPRRPPMPRARSQKWARNPIDALVAAAHEKHGLTPLPRADKRPLLRRVYLDLIGLPPTPQEVEAFLADKSPDAYEKVVDRLLASPHYGERWGRHWMDVWRYSDWYGYTNTNQFRNSHPHIWRWRDWIVESLNRDKGYDQMILEMLAGDEIAPTDPSITRATGYLARNWYRFNRNVSLNETVDHTAFAFLGVSLKCARCHDHKYDPISQQEYYRFRAFFEPYDVRLEPVPGQPNLTKDGLARIFDAEPREATIEPEILPAVFAKTHLFIRGDEKNPDKETVITPGVPNILGGQEFAIEPVELPVEAYYPAIRDFVHKDLVAEAEKQTEKAQVAFRRASRRLAEARTRAADANGDPEAQGDPVAADAAAAERFQKEVRPVLEKNCFRCHSAETGKSGLILENFDGLLQGGNKNGPAVIRRSSAESPLIQYLRGEKETRMPLGADPLPDDEITRIARWIDELPEEHPQVTLRKAETAAMLAEKELASARAYLPALEARIAADKAKFTNPENPDHPSLADAARKAERRANLVKAEENLLRAHQKLAEVLALPPAADDNAEKAREKKIAAARKELETAQTALSKAIEQYTPVGKLYPKTSTGRRTALARWIASKENPLTARVAINHMWMRHFGEPLVTTVTNFGKSGKPPTHPELLDWLAVELMEKKWSMKALHRLMVTSNTYQMQSSPDEPDHPNLKIDPQNLFLWRMNPRRMEAELVRDSLLHTAGQLETTVGGPTIQEEEGLTSRRRSIYFRITPDEQMEFLKMFDVASPIECYERRESVIPQQALALVNSKLSFTAARTLARDLSKEAAREKAFINAVFERILGRPPKLEEIAECENFLKDQAELFRDGKNLTPFTAGEKAEIAPASDPGLRARENLVHVLLNHNEFVTIR